MVVIAVELLSGVDISVDIIRETGYQHQRNWISAKYPSRQLDGCGLS